uniref:Chromosome 7 open reading frame 25 n=2 Tax=Iconisemion striatum TaxID=60296 RepID=A0A1A7XU24_9TELE
MPPENHGSQLALASSAARTCLWRQESKPRRQTSCVSSGDAADMSLQVMLQQRISSTQVLLQRVAQLYPDVEGHQKLCSKLRAELRFLKRVESGQLQVKESHLHSTNLTHLTAIVDAAQSLKGVVALLHVFTYQDTSGHRRTLVVDVVANGGHTWVKAVGRKAEALHNIWQGRGQYGDKSIIRQAEEFLQASRQQPVQYQNPHIVFAFYNGVSCPMADHLRDMGLSVRGDIVAVSSVETAEQELAKGDEDEIEADEIEEVEEKDEDSAAGLTLVERGTVVAHLAFPSQMQVEECRRVNLDITTLITYVSSLSHGRCHFTFREPVLTEQAAQERRQQILPQLEAFMEGKQLFACCAAVHDFQVILETLGGPGEKERAQKLLARLHLVDDQPSERTLRLKPSAKINRRSLMIFGSGDTLKAVTMTANSRFIRAAANQGVCFSVFIHQPRALTEGKEWRATPI